MKPHNVFIGYDSRQPIAYTVLQHSIIKNASRPVSITPLVLNQLPVRKSGVTEFSFSRFLVPYLCDYEGKALFLDSDMVVTGDVTELFDLPLKQSVYIVKDQPRFEWCSFMLFNNSKCKSLTLEYLMSDKDVRSFEWALGVGELHKDWNYCVGYDKPREAKLYHYTQGIPCFPETNDLEADEWTEAYYEATHTDSWDDIMGQSVHAEKVRQRYLQRTSEEAA